MSSIGKPEFKLNFNEYLNEYLTQKKEKTINKKTSQKTSSCKKQKKKFNVDSKILASLWFVETSIWRHLGKFDILKLLLP